MADQVTLYGISNCDSVKKSKKWLDDQSISYDFHNYKKAGIDAERLTSWCQQVGWEVLINKRGTTWRNLSDSQKSDLDQNKAISLMLENTSLIKRPVIDFQDKILVGFDEYRFS